jgi:excisionase family DNA binding protein
MTGTSFGPYTMELTMKELPKTITVPEAGAEYFGLSRNAAYAAATRGDIPTIRVGKLLRVPVRALEQMLDAVPVKKAEVA